jgi:hypothetical protein
VHTAIDVVLFVAGATLTALALLSAVRSMILPRGVPSKLARSVFIWTRVVFWLRMGRTASYERRDRVMAMFAPIALLALLTSWLLCAVVGFTGIYLGTGVRPLRAAFEISGSSMFTLGTATSPHLAPTVLTYVQAGLGLLLLTLLITYLPSIYGAFSRRELAVTMLEVRAGSPPSAVELLLRHHRIEKIDRLSELWQQWELWFVDIEETHTSLAGLAFFRSPQPDHSWVTAGGTVLDAAALRSAAIAGPREPDAELCLRAGYLALRRIATFFRVPYDHRPQPDDPISITREEFDEVYDALATEGVKMQQRDKAWTAFAGWRVNYDTVLLNLARFVEAPLAPWTSDRSPLRAHLTWTFGDMVRGRYGTRAVRRRKRRLGEQVGS